VAGRILKEDVDALRREADIAALVGDYTTLKRAGRSYKGLCPFHSERTPSFHVTPGENFFHCFGCDASGDVYDFLMRIEGLDFPEAVESLARRSGVTLRYEQLSARDRQALGERSRLLAATRAAQTFFTERLFAEEGEVARAYLRSRGFGRAEAETFGLGFAPNRWEALSDALRARGIPAEDLIATGLALRSDRGRLRDRFRGRLIFPVQDPGGDPIGFGGRVLPDLDYGDFDPPKYLNSPETPLYRKTKVLYGIPQARAEIVRAEQVLVCEGYTDVMALHQAGFANAVATCGTAVGEEHLRMVARYAPRVVLAFDGDAAGAKAAERAWDAARAVAGSGGDDDRPGLALDLRVLVLPEGQDPADLAAAIGADGLRAAVADATPVVPFVIRHRLRQRDLGSEAGRAAALREAVELLGREADPDLRRAWARSEVAPGVGVAYDFVTRTAQRLGVALDAHEGVATVRPSVPATDGSLGERDQRRRRARRERDLLRVALQAPHLLPPEWDEVREDDLTHPTARAVMRALKAVGGADAGLAPVLEVADDDQLRATIRGLAVEEEPVELDAEVAAWRVRSVLADRLEQQESALRARLEQLHPREDLDELLAVQRELLDLQRRRRALTTVDG
jgi:DNA primase